MRMTLILIAVLFAFSKAVLAEEDAFSLFGLSKESDFATKAIPNCVMAPTPVFRILAEDVLQDSVRHYRRSAQEHNITWTYTEAGAQKILAFWEANQGKETQYVFGTFETQPSVWTFRPTKLSTNFAQFKQNWLKRRGETLFVRSEADVKTVTAALKSK